jgi:hypothetical protein
VSVTACVGVFPARVRLPGEIKNTVGGDRSGWSLHRMSLGWHVCAEAARGRAERSATSASANTIALRERKRDMKLDREEGRTERQRQKITSLFESLKLLAGKECRVDASV